MGGIAETSGDEYGEPFDTVRAIIDRVKQKATVPYWNTKKNLIKWL